MYLPFIITLFLFFTIKLNHCNKAPVVGILTQETYWSRFRNTTPLHSTYIAASYVKAVEASGGRVIPVFTNRTTAYYAYEIIINIKIKINKYS